MTGVTFNAIQALEGNHGVFSLIPYEASHLTQQKKLRELILVAVGVVSMFLLWWALFAR